MTNAPNFAAIGNETDRARDREAAEALKAMEEAQAPQCNFKAASGPGI